MNTNSQNKNTRIELILSSISSGELKRLYSSLEKSFKVEDYVPKNQNKSIIVNNLSKLDEIKDVIKSIGENIIITEKELKNIYRYVFYLQNLDCAACGLKVERICSKQIDCEKVTVDFATLKIIIESSCEYEQHELQMKIQECAEMVDPRIDTKKSLEKKEVEEFRISKQTKITFILGVSIFAFFFLLKTILKFVLYIDNFWVYLIIYIGYTPAYILLAKDILVGAVKNLINHRFFDEMFLMALATVTALLIGYYDEALFLITFYNIGSVCQQYAVNYSRRSIAGLASLKVDKAIVDIDGQKLEMEPDGVVVGDTLYVTQGNKVALDGIVIEGYGLIDKKALTGESKPLEVKPGDEVDSGSIVIDGTLRIKVTHSYENSIATKILDVVENASTLKSKSENFISKFAKYYTPLVVLFAVVIAVFLPFTNLDKYTLDWQGFRESLRVAMIFLVVSCPCALVISIPLGFFGGIGSASKRGILVKGSNYLETLNHIDICIFDKTGTLTKGNFKVKKVVSLSEYTEDQLLAYAAYAESTSNHVIAKSIIECYGKELDNRKVTQLYLSDKRGIMVKVEDSTVAIGRKQFMLNLKMKIPALQEVTDELFIAINDKIAGYILIEDEIRSEAKEAVNQIKELGVKSTVILTGDSEMIARRVAEELDIDKCYADMNPLDKVNKLLKYKRNNQDKKIAFVGDGLNDAPVISVADVGIALGGFSSDATTQTADIVIMDTDLNKLVTAIRIAKKTHTIVVENIIFSLIIKGLFLVLAPFNIINDILIFGAIFADVGVSLLAILNSLRALKIGEKK